MRDLLYVPPGRAEPAGAIGLFVPEFANPVFAALAEAMETHAARERARDDPLQHARLGGAASVDYVHMLLERRRRGHGLHLRRDHRRPRRATRTTRKLLERGARLVFVNGGSEELDVTSRRCRRACRRTDRDGAPASRSATSGSASSPAAPTPCRPARRRSATATRCAQPGCPTASSRTPSSRVAGRSRRAARAPRTASRRAADRRDLLERPDGDRCDAGGSSSGCAFRTTSRSSDSTGSTPRPGRNPPLTTVEQPIDEIARTAVEALRAQVARAGRATAELRVPARGFGSAGRRRHRARARRRRSPRTARTATPLEPGTRRGRRARRRDRRERDAAIREPVSDVDETIEPGDVRALARLAADRARLLLAKERAPAVGPGVEPVGDDRTSIPSRSSTGSISSWNPIETTSGS